MTLFFCKVSVIRLRVFFIYLLFFFYLTRFNSVAKFSPTKLNQTEFLTNQGINSYLFTEGALDFSPTKRNLLLILEIATLRIWPGYLTYFLM